MIRHLCSRLTLGWAGIGLILSLATGSAVADPATHLDWANLLVDTIDPAYNVYDSSPTYVYWEGYDGHSYSENRSKCSTFTTKLLEKAYSEDIAGWMGCSSPNAMTYHDTIESENGFVRITNIASIQAGDILAIAYDDAGCTNVTCGSFQTCSSSGHVATVASAPTLRSSTSPIVSGTTQYNVLIVDSSSTYHGSADTRYQAEANGTHDSGVGRGTMRLYTDGSGEIVGYTWSTFSNSTYYSMNSRHLVVGRYNP